MGLGILDDHALDNVPGTAHVLDSEEQRRRIEDAGTRGGRALKYDKTGKILLVPQPGEGMDDPLNWSLPRRDIATLILSLTSILASTLSPLLAANTVSLAIFFRHNFTDMALLTGYHLLGVGLAGFVIVPSARIWGKRHVYLLGMLLIIGSCVWAGATGPNYNSFLAARVVQGVGLAPFEALVNASVADMYCVHQRGGRMALVNFAVFGGAFATPVFAGIITDRLGYQWTFYFVAIFMAAMVPCVVLWVPETTVWRGEGWGVDSLGNLVIVDTQKETDPAKRRNGEEKVPSSTSTTSTSSPSPQPSYLSTLSPFSGRKTPDSFLHLLLRPFSLFLHPGILWACLIQGVLIGFTVLIGITLAAIMLGPPLWFGELETGYMYTGAFIGALLGFALSGLIADPSAAWLTRLNGGTYEPEFRLVLVVPQLVFGAAGIIGFGYTAADAQRYGWFWPDFFFALVVMGMVCGAVASALYLVDAHRDMEIEAFTCLLVFKNLFSFALTFKGFDWIVEAGRKGGGVKEVFVAVGAAQVGVCALTIPMYIFGKKNRSFWHSHNVFFKATDWVADKVTFW